jgi:hypothetical protein
LIDTVIYNIRKVNKQEELWFTQKKITILIMNYS